MRKKSSFISGIVVSRKGFIYVIFLKAQSQRNNVGTDRKFSDNLLVTSMKSDTIVFLLLPQSDVIFSSVMLRICQLYNIITCHSVEVSR